MKGVILDADSLGDIDLSPITDCFEVCAVHASTKTGEVSSRIQAADVVLSNKIPLPAAMLSQANQLKYISIMATGTNNVDLIAARKIGIPVSNAIAYATPSVVQHTVSLMLCLSTNISGYIADVRAGSWQQSSVFTLLSRPIAELSGKTLGIIGYGELGRNVALVAEAFGMKILIASRRSEPGRLAIEKLLPEVDYLSLHCPLTTENANLIDMATLAMMKPTAFLINTARGGLVNSADLVKALETGVIAGAAIDVLNSEPPTDDEPLIQANHLQNLLLTPHNAWGAIESRQRLVVQMQENIQSFIQGHPVRLVN